MTENPIPIIQGLNYLSDWIKAAAGGPDFMVWSHGASFDLPILTELYRVFGIPAPWGHWQMRCTRTLYDLACVDKEAYAVLPKHDPLNDALTQARAFNAAMSIIAKAHA